VRKNIYLLVEEGFRELSSRLLIAEAAAGSNHVIWIGQQWWFAENFARLPPGVVLFKGNNAIQVENMRRAKAAGHVVASMEEEAFGLSVFDGEKMYDERAGQYCDLFCVQGASLAAFVRGRVPGSAEKIVITGNPRTDLLLPPHDAEIHERAARIAADRGPFVLVNTNYASINPFDIDIYNYYRRCVEIAVYDDNDPQDWEKFSQLIDWETRNLGLMMAFIQRWPEIDGAPIVVRPHPSESLQFWHDTMAPLGHVDVIEDTDHLAWIAASRLMIHTSSTTGLEAFLLGTPSMNLCPPNSPFSTHFISSIVNPSFDTVEEALRQARARVLDVKQSKTDNGSYWSRLDRHLATDHVDTAAARVAEALLDVHPDAVEEAASRRPPQSFLKVTNTARQTEKARMDLETISTRLSGLEVTEVAPLVFSITAPEARSHG
jgi:surface carbohydrate biosynthesis protein